ncbi:uncharacterized protein LOC135695667 [Rhopilema esculentum]|uniref:uncharacterized protein LOC135695667 n=1 Tax=Rhopilema esculentum TaxID=499914 RepID=UPI0031D29D56
MANGDSKNAARLEMSTERPPNPDEVARYIKTHPELERPLWFPNHQGKFIAFTWLTCAFMTCYFVFWHEFPQEEHCFSSIRRYAQGWRRRLFTVDETEDEQVQKHIENLKQRIDAKKAQVNEEQSKTVES